MTENTETQYRIVGLLGVGGFGRVYRARLEATDGFMKEVAVKLLTDDEAPLEVLTRLKDEARILGLVRDRAVVGVEPPTRLGGRWALVMEFVDGGSCDQILHAKGAFPPGVVLEVVGEVARALDNCWSHPGPDGAPMQVLHRDLKPANIQITPTGQVKILDFGISRGQFQARESETTGHIGGTVGYIAPERLSGTEEPSGDIYSLGVVAFKLLTGRRRTRIRRRDRELHNRLDEDSAFGAVLRLAVQMCDPDPDKRPTARQVEKEAEKLRWQHEAMRLRDWAPGAVPRSAGMPDDELVGTVFTGTMSGIGRMPDRIGDTSEILRRRSPKVALLAGGSAALMFALVGFAMLFVALLYYSSGGSMRVAQFESDPGSPPNLEVRQPGALVDASEAPPLVTTVEASTVLESASDIERPADRLSATPQNDASVESRRHTAAETRPVGVAHKERLAPTVVALVSDEPESAAEEVAEPASVTAPSGPSMDVIFSSIPLDVEVRIDGQYIGHTPIIGHSLGFGEHTIEMLAPDGKVSHDITVGRRSPSRFIWDVAGDTWEATY